MESFLKRNSLLFLLTNVSLQHQNQIQRESKKFSSDYESNFFSMSFVNYSKCYDIFTGF